MKKAGKLATGVAAASLLASCGGGGGSENPSNLPELKQSTTSIAQNEATNQVYDILNMSCKNSTNYSLTQADGTSAIASPYSLDANGKLVVDLSGVNIADGVNETDTLKVTCSDGTNSSSVGDIEITKQDTANDNLMTASSNMPSSVNAGSTYTGTITLTDTDSPTFGTLPNNIDYNVYSGTATSGVSVINGASSIDSSSGSSKTYTIEFDSSSLSNGTNTIVISPVSPIDGGENDQAPQSYTYTIEVTPASSWMTVPDASVDDGTGGTPQVVISDIRTRIKYFKYGTNISLLAISGSEVSQIVLNGDSLEARITSDVNPDSPNVFKLRYTEPGGRSVDSNEFTITVTNTI